MILHRRVKNQRSAAAGHLWAFVSLKAAGPRARYDHRRKAGDRHSSVLRNTFDRMLGCLFHCLQNSELYDRSVAFGACLAALDTVAA